MFGILLGLIRTNETLMKTLAATFLLALGLVLNTSLTNDHLKVFEGKWTGNLTYLNYGDDKTLVTLPLEVDAEFTERGLKFVYLFTEPGGGIERRTDRFQLRKQGVFYNGNWETVSTNVTDLENWEMELTSKGKDNNRAAEFRKTVVVTPGKIVVTKLVKYKGTDEFFMRNKYIYERP